MSEPHVDGACLCGTVRFHIVLPTTTCIHCHCSMCRRNHGAGYVTWVEVPFSQLTFDAGEDELVRYESSPHGYRSFCGRCGTTILAAVTYRPEMAAIPLVSLQGRIDREPECHLFFDDRVAWSLVEDGLPRLGGNTGLEPLDEAAAELLKSWQP